MGALQLLGIALGMVLVLMTLVYLLSRIIKNAGVVDVAWSFGFTIVVALYVFLQAHQLGLRQYAIATMVLLWSLRLTYHLGARFLRWYPEEDARYSALRVAFGNNPEVKMFTVFLWQGFIMVLMTAPIAVVMADSHSSWAPFWNSAGLAVWGIGLIGETLADAQLARFTKDSSNKGKTCQIGLWAYSRHPNYFFEWLIAVGFFIYALASPYGVFTVIACIVLLHLLINVTGVKPAEEHSLASRSDYREYMRTTSMFVPWFRRTAS